MQAIKLKQHCINASQQSRRMNAEEHNRLQIVKFAIYSAIHWSYLQKGEEDNHSIYR